MPLHAPDQALEHLAHLAGPKVPETLPGWKGGLAFGFFLGLVVFFQRFYDPLVIDGFPYYLSWCQGGISMIDSLLAGAVIGAILKT